MPVIEESTYDDRALTRHLLGQLAGEEADRLDELAIVDDDMAWRVRAVENDLVDAYVRGGLDAESRRHFEAYYLASPKRRARVRFAERFVRAVDAFGPPTERPERRRVAVFAESRPWLNRLVPRSAARWTVVYAAAAILVIACSVLLIRDLRPAPAPLESEQAARIPAATPLPSPPSPPPSGASPSSPQSPVAAAPVPTAPAPAVPVPAGPVPAVAVVLWPQTRGTDEGAVAVPAAATRVTLQLQVETLDFARYAATLKESDTGRIVWRGGRISASASGASPMVPIVVPAHVLKPRAYMLELTGHSAAPGPADAAKDGEVIGSYAFQVTRQ